MSAGTSLVRAWHAPYEHGPWPWRVPGAERVLIRRPGASGVAVSLLRSSVAGTWERVPESAPPADEHLVAGPDEADRAWLSCADVIVRRVELPVPARWSLSGVHARFPGCLVAVLIHHGPGCATVGTATGWRARLVPLRAGAFSDDEVVSYASVIHLWMVTGRPLAELHTARLLPAAVRRGMRVKVGGRCQGRAVPERSR